MNKILTAIVSFAVVALLAGCQEKNLSSTTGPGETSASGNGSIVVRLMDAPAAYSEVNIKVDSVRIHVESGDTINGWYTISRLPATYNLLEYANGKDTIIAEGIIPAGYYSQLRLYIGHGSNVVRDGVPIPLEIPSGSQSGLKLNIQATILPAVKYVLTLDFDATRSIVVTGNGRYKLKPVIKTVATAISGSLTGIVAPDTTHATLYAIAGEDTSTTIAEATGFFKFKYLLPATYKLKIVPADTSFRDTTLTSIAILAAQNTDVGTITLQKK